MPYRKITLPPGINREGTQYSAEGNWFDCDLIRFRQDRPEKIGGWEKYSENEFLGVSRALHNWVSIGGSNFMAVGSDKKLYVELGGVYYDITPMDYKSQGTLVNDPGVTDGDTSLTFNFAVADQDVVRMGGDANIVGDELMLITTAAIANNPTTGVVRGSFGTIASAHGFQEAAFRLENLSSPIRLVQNSTTVLIKWIDHGVNRGDFVNFLKVGSALTSITSIDVRDLYYPFHASGIDRYDTAKSTQSFPVTKVLNSEYFEIRISTAPTGLSSSSLFATVDAASQAITLTASTPAWATGDIVKIGDEYIELVNGSASAGFTACLRSQFGSVATEHPAGAVASEVGIAGAGQGGDTIIMRDLQSSESTFTEFTGWGSGAWSGIPPSTISTTLTNYLFSYLSVADVSSTIDFGPSGSTGTMLIDSELISYTVLNIPTFNPIARGQLGTTTANHSGGSSVFLVDKFWTAWGAPTVPPPMSSDALNVWSLDTFGETLVAAKDKSKPYYWDTQLKVRNGLPNLTESNSGLGYASGIMLADAVPLSSYGNGMKINEFGVLSPDAGYGLVPDQVGFIMSYPATRQLIAFGATDTFGTYDPMLVRWCDQNALGSWRPVQEGGNRAGGFPLDNGSRIISAAKAAPGIIVWTDKAIYAMTQTTGNAVFNLAQISDSVSIASRHAHRVAGGNVYWMGDNNFYVHGSRGIEDLECSVLSKVFDDLNYSKRETITAALNSLFNEIIWFYPSSLSDEPDSYVIFNYIDQNWAYGRMARTAWSDAGIRENPNSAYNRGPYTSGLYEDINRSIIYNQEMGYTDDKSKMNSYVETGFIDAAEGDVSMFMDRIVPDYRQLGVLSPQLTISVSAKDYPFSTDSKTSSVDTNLNTEYSNIRLRGRTISLKFEDNPAAPVGSGWQLGDPRLRMKPDGER